MSSTSVPFEQVSTPNIERANRLLSLKSHPGFLDVLRLSQELVKEAADLCADYPGWDPQQITVLKVRMQVAKEHHRALIGKIMEAIQIGIEEGRAALPSMPEKSSTEVMEQGDLVRQAVLEKFEDADMRAAGSY